MPQTVQMAGNNLGGTIQGTYGVYQQASDGTYTVDTRDVPSMLTLGASYVRKITDQYGTYPVVPTAANATRFVASVNLSNGALTIAAQPDVMRQGQLVIGQIASPGPSGGTAAFTYLANDGTTVTDTFNLSAGNVLPATLQTSKGVAHIQTGVISGLAGSGFVTFGTTAALALSLNPGAVDLALIKETNDGGDATLGTFSTSLGCVVPSAAPNGTHTFGWTYTYIAPET